MSRLARLVVAVTGAVIVASAAGLSAVPAAGADSRTSGATAGATATATRGCDPAPNGEIAVFIVVDFGESAPGDTPEPACVVVPDGATGTDVLEERARLLGTPPPRYNASGLLCAIDGRPDSGCGARDGDRYLYWSYWQGTREGWDYADIGPSSLTVSATRAEGWHFVRGAALPGDPPPRVEPFASPARRLGSDPDGADDAIGDGEAGRGDRRSSAEGGLSGLVTGAVVVLALVAGGMWMARRRAASATGGAP